jgi:hypothetical protein
MPPFEHHDVIVAEFEVGGVYDRKRRARRFSNPATGDLELSGSGSAGACSTPVRDDEHRAERSRGPHGQDGEREHVLLVVEVDSFAYRGHGGA